MMIQIDDKVVSSDLLEQQFCCNLAACKGLCCVHGDSGAPLTEEETRVLPTILPKIEPYLTEKGLRAINEQGTHTIDSDNDLVTPLIDGKECAYTYFENGIALCAIEKAWLSRKIDFRKPISCHLYPIRVKHYDTFTAINYDIWHICKPARISGQEKGLPVFRYLKEAIIRAFGKEFFAQLEEAEKLLSSHSDNK